MSFLYKILYKNNLTLEGVGGGLVEWKVWSLIVCYNFIFSVVGASKDQGTNKRTLMVLGGIYSIHDELKLDWKDLKQQIVMRDVLKSHTDIILLQQIVQHLRVWVSIWIDKKRFMNCNKLDKK